MVLVKRADGLYDIKSMNKGELIIMRESMSFAIKKSELDFDLDYIGIFRYRWGEVKRMVVILRREE